jgi:hypothetical protein
VGDVAAIVLLDLVPLGAALEPSVVGSFAAVAGQEELPGTYFSVVLCELGKGFKGLWIPYQHRSIR